MEQRRPPAEHVLRAAIAYNRTDAARIHHLIKVTGFAQAIAETLDAEDETEDDGLSFEDYDYGITGMVFDDNIEIVDAPKLAEGDKRKIDVVED